MNFKEETLKEISESGHEEKDVLFIGSKDGKLRISIEKFKEISDFDYDSGFGGQEIPQDLIVYFKDKSYLDRREYDGSEWWKYNELLDFSAGDEYKDFNKIGRSGDYLEEINKNINQQIK